MLGVSGFKAAETALSLPLQTTPYHEVVSFAMRGCLLCISREQFYVIDSSKQTPLSSVKKHVSTNLAPFVYRICVNENGMLNYHMISGVNYLHVQIGKAQLSFLGFHTDDST